MRLFSWLDRIRHAREQRTLGYQKAERLGAQAFDMLESGQNIAAAASLFRRALRLKPGEAHWHVGLGRCYLEQVRARLVYLELCPADRAGIVERYGQALACFERALRRDGRNAETHFWRGQLLVLRGLEEEACRAWKRALSLEPTHEAARRSLAEVGARLAAAGPPEPLF